MDKYAQIMFWLASLTVADEFSFRPTLRFARASSGIVGAVNAARPIPTVDEGCPFDEQGGGAVDQLGGKALAGARPPLPWKKIGLWGVLLFGVALIGAMSFSLHSALRKEGEE